MKLHLCQVKRDIMRTHLCDVNLSLGCLVSKDLQQQFLHDLRSRVPKEMQKRGITKSIDLRSALLGPNISEDAFSHQALRMKLLQFCEDVRPAYYGNVLGRVSLNNLA